MNLIPYPPLEKIAVIGDCRTAGLVAADGTLAWLCLPRFDSKPVFGALLDADRGGYWRFGPEATALGEQAYPGAGCPVVTRWSTPEGTLELCDAMFPHGEGHARGIVRRLRCTRGRVECRHTIEPRCDFGPPCAMDAAGGALRFRLPDMTLNVRLLGGGVPPLDAPSIRFSLAAGEEVYAVLGVDCDDMATREQARAALEASGAQWRALGSMAYSGPRLERVRRTCLLVHLLTYEPSGAVVAAPTSSIPERVGDGGGGNWDYRFAWIRDTSLALAVLSVLGDTESARKYMEWLCRLAPGREGPLQVLYRPDGSRDATEVERRDIAGYRGSAPVRFGNRACEQRQLDAYGFLCDCILVFLQQHGAWSEEYWPLVERSAEYVLATWREPDNGIWELPERRQYVSGKVMAWVALDRAVKIARRVRAQHSGIARWSEAMAAIHDEVMARGWSERLQSFRQHYDDESLDASVLLMPVMDFLPATHPRIVKTVERIEATLSADGFVYRFDPVRTFARPGAPMGENEAAFLPCTFWLATAHAKAGRPDRAERILDRAEAIAGRGWFAECVDPRDARMRGNYPLLFAQIEYVRAVLETAKAKPLQMAEMLPGLAVRTVRQIVAAGRRGTKGESDADARTARPPRP